MKTNNEKITIRDNLPAEEKQFFDTLDILIESFRYADVKPRRIIASRTYKFTIALLNELVEMKKTAEDKA